MPQNHLILTFDTEEFDLPTEYGIAQTKEEQLELGKKGTEVVLKILEKYNLTATFFITGYFAKHNKDLIKNIAQHHEVALHGSKHSDDYANMHPKEAEECLKKARREVEKIIKKPILGFRAPRFQHPPLAVIKAAGFTYDSSLHPTFVPGRYNNLSKPRTPFRNDALIEFPISVSPLIRLPFSWIWFRKLPLIYTTLNSRATLASTHLLHLYFHPWEFIDVPKKNAKIASILTNTGKPMIKKFEHYLDWCRRKKVVALTIEDYLKKKR